MTEVAMVETTSLLDNNQPLTDEQFHHLVMTVRSSAFQKEKFSSTLQSQSGKAGSDHVLAMKMAQGCYALCQYRQALEWLAKAGQGRQQSFLKACALRALNEYTPAIEALQQAQEKGHDSFEITMAQVDCLRSAGQLDQAKEKLDSVSRVGDIRAEYHFQLGWLHDVNGRHEQAIDEYERAIALDGNHHEALFRLAYALDLYGDEQQAIGYYERCLKSGAIHVSALLNLAVLYEEAGDYEKARRNTQQVLTAHPNHQRAQMFMKDIISSMTMFYDEDHERRIDLRNQVLQIPISDFELSVRSRNCLKKMNIRTLGDLLRVTEPELLAYKNFGETSLQEIKCILQTKNLRLGQMLEDRPNDTRVEDEDEDSEESALLAAPINELELSVRARKGLQRLNINTLGDLVKRTEAELLGCKNFGMMSLNEIKQSLKDKGLELRQLDD